MSFQTPLKNINIVDKQTCVKKLVFSFLSNLPILPLNLSNIYQTLS